MTFRESLNAQWFEVVEGGFIVFAGPLQMCGDYVAAKNGVDNNGHNLIIRLATF